ncbi:DUF2007 domain-containing protein [Hungatella effluvii]|uniref:putative signal transducing protein n=1 Tax=Hungatella effluvii TaxID=1096246 RepID=UPI0022E13BF4|nr:DUF2007 domain-containing protein [Hungatella effluvii]
MTMKCPNCGAEFLDGREVCTDCQTPLVKKEEGENGKAEFASEGVEVEMLTTVSDHIEAKLLQGILENHGIPSYSVDEESGEYMRVYMGYSIFGEKIYVRASDLLAAQGYLKEWESVKENAEVDEDYVAAEDSEAEGDLDEDGDSEDEEGENGWRNPLILKDRRLAAIIIIAAVILGIISVFPPIP